MENSCVNHRIIQIIQYTFEKQIKEHCQYIDINV